MAFAREYSLNKSSTIHVIYLNKKNKLEKFSLSSTHMKHNALLERKKWLGPIFEENIKIKHATGDHTLAIKIWTKIRNIHDIRSSGIQVEEYPAVNSI